MMFQIVMAVVVLILTGGFVCALFTSSVSEESCFGLGFSWLAAVLLFGSSFLK
jgi:hypothetical protein